MRAIDKKVVMSELKGWLLPEFPLHSDERVVVTNVFGELVIFNDYEAMLEYGIEQFTFEEFTNEYYEGIQRDKDMCELLNEVTDLEYVIDGVCELVNNIFKPQVAIVRG